MPWRRLIVARWLSLSVLSILSAVEADAASSSVVISQVYGGGGTIGATYRNDFIELFNRGNTAVSLSGWTVQYAAGNSNNWQPTFLGGTIQPGHYYLIQEAQGTGGSLDLPPANATSSVNLAPTAGKVALVNNGTTLSGNCPSGPEIVDFVGYGSVNCSETSSAPTPGNTTAVLRLSDGCTETDNNAADFTVGAPNPRNSFSPENSCASGPTFTSATYTANKVFVGQFTADAQRSNTVLFSTNLVAWFPLNVALSNSGAVFTFADTNVTPHRFYRVLSQ
jgi:hypothetical protein